MNPEVYVVSPVTCLTSPEGLATVRVGLGACLGGPGTPEEGDESRQARFGRVPQVSFSAALLAESCLIRLR